MSLYPVASHAAASFTDGGVPGAGLTVAFRLGDAVPPLRGGRPLGDGDRPALVIGGTARIRAGDVTVFCKVVAVAQARVRRDGRVQAQGSPAEHATLGPAEEWLDHQAGPGALDGTLIRVPDTPANRAAFGSVGTGDDSSPFPQLRALPLNDVSTRALLGMPHGPAGTDKAAAEQKLLDTAMRDYPHLFTADRLWLMDRNFPGAARIARLMARTHVLIRLLRHRGPSLGVGHADWRF